VETRRPFLTGCIQNMATATQLLGVVDTIFRLVLEMILKSFKKRSYRYLQN